MIIAGKAEKKRVTIIISDTFDKNPSVNIVIGEGGNRHKKLTRLGNYAFIKAMNRKGAFLSDNKMAVALCYISDEGKGSLSEVWSELLFALAIPVKKVLQTLKREKYIKEHRSKDRHLYFWFLGAQKGSEHAVFELKDAIFELSEIEQLPILLETSVSRNRAAYERYGFYVYHTWADSGNGHELWFMRRDPK